MAVGEKLDDGSFCQASTSQVPEGACVPAHREENQHATMIPLRRSNNIQPARKTASKNQLRPAPPRSQAAPRCSTVEAPLQEDQSIETANEVLYLARLQVEILRKFDMKFDKHLEKFDKILEKFDKVLEKIE